VNATQNLLTQMATLLGADTTTLAAVAPFVEVALVKVPFVPGPALVLNPATDLADFTGGSPIHAASAATQIFVDPVSGAIVIQCNEPAGGWHWLNTALLHVPQTIYGWSLWDPTLVTLYGAERLPVPIDIVAIGQAIDVGQVKFTMLLTPLV
jgi:hypothetical protein